VNQDLNNPFELRLITYIGCGISVGALIVTICLYLGIRYKLVRFRKLREKCRNISVKQYMFLLTKDIFCPKKLKNASSKKFEYFELENIKPECPKILQIFI
jgi:hypothetical protein